MISQQKNHDNTCDHNVNLCDHYVTNICKYCNKLFTNKYYRWWYEKNYKIKINIIKENLLLKEKITCNLTNNKLYIITNNINKISESISINNQHQYYYG
jgi:hypothetical protein